MATDNIPDELMDALIENTRVMNTNVDLLTSVTTKSDKEETKEKNLVPKPKDSSSLSSTEKLRYQNIGKELFKPFIMALEQMLIKEKRAKAMLVGNDTKTIKKAAAKQEKTSTSGKKETSWWEILIKVGLIGMMVFMAFREKIEGFFSNFGQSMKKVFSEIWEFVNITNPNSGLRQIIGTVSKFFSTVWSSVWSFVKPAFTSLGNLGSDLWNWITQKWEDCITGPNGLLSMIPQAFNAVKNWVSDGVSFVGNIISEAIINPIKELFGGAKDDAKNSAETAREKAEKQIEENTEKIKAEQKEQAKIANSEQPKPPVQKNEDVLKIRYIPKQLNEEQVKGNIAAKALDKYLKSVGQNPKNFDEDDRKRYENIFKEHIQLKDGKASMNLTAALEAMHAEAKANKKGYNQWKSSLDRELHLANEENFKRQTGAFEKFMEDSLKEAGASLVSVGEIEKITSEKLDQAIASEHKEFISARQTVVDAVGALQSSMKSFDNDIFEKFSSLFQGFADKFFKLMNIEIEITTPKHEEIKNYSYNNTTNNVTNYNQTIEDESPTVINILPVKKEAFKVMNEQISELVKETVKIINSQNSILEDIKVIIGSNTQATEKSTQIIAANTAANSTPRGSQSMSRGARSLENGLWRTAMPY